MDEKLLIARADDLVRLCNHTGAPKFLGFLSEKEAALVKKHLEKSGACISFFGGYEGALRTYLCVAPENFSVSAYPLSAVTFTYRAQDKLLHRDFLGSLTALGIAREKIGDILIESGRAVVFAELTAAKYILSELKKVGRVGITVKQGFEPPLPQTSVIKEFTDTIASLRLDCVVACLCNISRKEAIGYIEKDMVSVNSFAANKATAKISADDMISVRKKGKFVIRSVDGVSKKGRTILVYDKYI